MKKFETKESAIEFAIAFLTEKEVRLSRESFTSQKVCENEGCHALTKIGKPFSAPVWHTFQYGAWEEEYKIHLVLETMAFVCYGCARKIFFERSNPVRDRVIEENPKLTKSELWKLVRQEVGVVTLPAKEVYDAYQLATDEVAKQVHEKLQEQTVCAVSGKKMTFSDGCVLNRKAIEKVMYDENRTKEVRQLAAVLDKKITGKRVEMGCLAPFVLKTQGEILSKHFGEIQDASGEIALTFSPEKTLRRFFQKKQNAEKWIVRESEKKESRFANLAEMLGGLEGIEIPEKNTTTGRRKSRQKKIKKGKGRQTYFH